MPTTFVCHIGCPKSTAFSYGLAIIGSTMVSLLSVDRSMSLRRETRIWHRASFIRDFNGMKSAGAMYEPGPLKTLS